MISFEKAKMGKRLMKQFIAEGELEKAAFIGLMYQMPIRTGDAVTLQKSDLDGRIVLKASSKYGKLYTNRHGNPYRITRQLRSLLNSINRDSDFIFIRKNLYKSVWQTLSDHQATAESSKLHQQRLGYDLYTKTGILYACIP